MKKKEKNVADVYSYYNKKYRIPIDIDRLTANELRKLHSYWSQSYVHAQSMLQNYEAQKIDLVNQRRQTYNGHYINYKRARLANDLARIRSEAQKDVSELDNRIAVSDISIKIWSSLTESCRAFMQLCSRDQSWRQIEREEYNKKLGR